MTTNDGKMREKRERPLTRADVEKALREADSPEKLKLHGQNLQNADLANLDFTRVDLSGANLKRVNLSGANLSSANLSEADLSGANLMRATLIASNLSRATLRWANLSMANLSGADLIATNLTDADLSKTQLFWANFSGANLSGSDLSEAYLREVILTQTILKGATVAYAYVSEREKELLRTKGVIGLDETQSEVHSGAAVVSPPPSADIKNSPSVIHLRIKEEPLTARNLTTIMLALTELYTQCWLIQQGRFIDIVEYDQTHYHGFDDEAHLIINKLTYNSPAEIKFDVSLSPKNIAEAIKIAIDAIVQVFLRHEEVKLENQSKVLEMKLKEQEAALDEVSKKQTFQIGAQKAELEAKEQQLTLEIKQLEIETQRLEIQEKRLDVEKKRYEYALETANKMVVTLYPEADADPKIQGMLSRMLLPNLLQLGNSKGLEIVLSASESYQGGKDNPPSSTT